MQRIHPFVEQHEVNAVQRKHFARQRAGVGADKTDGVVGVLLLERPAQGGGADHIGRAGIRILAVNDQADQARIGFRDAFDGSFDA